MYIPYNSYLHSHQPSTFPAEQLLLNNLKKKQHAKLKVKAAYHGQEVQDKGISSVPQRTDSAGKLEGKQYHLL